MSIAEPSALPFATDRVRLRDAVDRANRLITASSGNLRFRVELDRASQEVGVVDAQSGALMRHIPTEEMHAIARALDRMQGLMVNLKV
ncbi:MAG: flagellar protein FlaG [Betaproteobacteria bacterium]